MLLSIVVPVYQEERTVREVLTRVLAIDTRSLGFEKEIVVCDDGSTDRTVAEIEAVAQGHPEIRLFKHAQNRGKGAGIRTCLEQVTGDVVLIQDADLEYEVTDYPAILQAINAGADAVYGSRFMTTSRPSGMALANFVANKILTTTANLLYGHDITDEATCFKAIRTDVLRSLKLECERFEFCPEVTAKLGKKHVKIVEVPIAYHARDLEAGKKIRWTDGFSAFWVLVKHRLRP